MNFQKIKMIAKTTVVEVLNFSAWFAMGYYFGFYSLLIWLAYVIAYMAWLSYKNQAKVQRSAKSDALNRLRWEKVICPVTCEII